MTQPNQQPTPEQLTERIWEYFVNEFEPDLSPETEKTILGSLVEIITQATESKDREIERLTVELESRQKSHEHTKYWYSCRIERLKAYAKEKGFWPDMAAIIANGTLNPLERPTYMQQYNRMTWEVEKAHERAAQLESQNALLVEALKFTHEWFAENHLVGQYPSICEHLDDTHDWCGEFKEKEEENAPRK